MRRCRRQKPARERFVGLGGRAATTCFAGVGRIVLACRYLAVLLASGVLIELPGTTVSGNARVACGPHLRVAAAIRNARQPING
jgi:hypothetical protein